MNKCEHSFGINAAKISGMPVQIIDRAKEILNTLEKYDLKIKSKNEVSRIVKVEEKNNNDEFIRFKKIIDSIDTNKISPLEALLKLYEIKKISENIQI